MTGKYFVDSNIWVYFFTDDDPVRKAKAVEIIVGTQPKVASWQVISEVCSVLLRKKNANEPLVRTVIDHICESCEVIDYNADILKAASHFRARHQISFWDSLLVTAATAAGCSTFYSEDMRDGATYGRITIRNIFA